MGEGQEHSKLSFVYCATVQRSTFLLLPIISFACPPTAPLPSPPAPYPLSYSPGDAAATALPSSSLDRRPQCRHPLPLILPLPSTLPSPLSPFSATAVATSTATLSSHQGRDYFASKKDKVTYILLNFLWTDEDKDDTTHDPAEAVSPNSRRYEPRSGLQTPFLGGLNRAIDEQPSRRCVVAVSVSLDSCSRSLFSVAWKQRAFSLLSVLLPFDVE
ncbi:hypothetical protein TIFTF001_030144 [Ficus carica]|uniref:Uncharacterized protein n=1 Tax=Ficus carica TaxID=3494 RepID=A0AA88DSM8_FICCA|nr:hypothetical protein TIFTF001_030144 [Ficus carica]